MSAVFVDELETAGLGLCVFLVTRAPVCYYICVSFCVFFVYFVSVVVSPVVSTSATDCLERLISKTVYIVSSRTLEPTIAN